MSQSPDSQEPAPEAASSGPAWKRWGARLGKVAFWLFLLKGIGWIVIWVLAYLGYSELTEEEEGSGESLIEVVE